MNLSESAAMLTITTTQGQSKSVVMEGFASVIEANGHEAEQIDQLMHKVAQVGG